MSVKQIAKDAYNWLTDDKNKALRKWANRIFTVVLILWIVKQFSSFDYKEILREIPTNPFFYIIWLLLFCVVPISEYLIYKSHWKYTGIQPLKAFFEKKIYNNELQNYSGEIFFIGWARKELGISIKEATHIVKDNNIVSSIVSTVLAFIILFVLSMFGYFDILSFISSHSSVYYVVGAVFLVIAFVAAYLLRDKIFSIPSSMFYKLTFYYSIRFISRHILLLIQWMIAAPDIALGTLLNYMTVKILLDKLPVSNKDLILVSITPAISSNFDVAQTTLTTIFLVTTVLNKFLHLVTYIWAKTHAPKAIQTDTEK